jgi:hypothetical protein
MTRRRLILAIVAAVFVGMAWWLSLDRLSAEERVLVGTWTFDGESGTGSPRSSFWPDRRTAYGRRQPDGTVKMFVWGGRWFIRDGALVFDGEPDAFRRTVRPFLRGFRLPYNGALTYRLDSITDRALVLVMSDGTRETWTRDRAD